MVKIKYIGMAGSVSTSGVRFMKNEIYEVTDKVAEYLKKSFTKNFEVIEEPKPRAKPTAKPKPAAKPKPKVEEIKE